MLGYNIIRNCLATCFLSTEIKMSDYFIKGLSENLAFLFREPLQGSIKYSPEAALFLKETCSISNRQKSSTTYLPILRVVSDWGR